MKKPVGLVVVLTFVVMTCACSHFQTTTEGDPIISQVDYDGYQYLYFEDDSRDTFRGSSSETFIERSYPYLVVYERKNDQLVYLVQDSELTYEEIMDSYLSSQSSDWIDCMLLYSF